MEVQIKQAQRGFLLLESLYSVVNKTNNDFYSGIDAN